MIFFYTHASESATQPVALSTTPGTTARFKTARALSLCREAEMRCAIRKAWKPGSEPDVAAAWRATQSRYALTNVFHPPAWASNTSGQKRKPARWHVSAVRLFVCFSSPHSE